jgi:lipopolysaccharide export LptBFGC system permease protein LptF
VLQSPEVEYEVRALQLLPGEGQLLFRGEEECCFPNGNCEELSPDTCKEKGGTSGAGSKEKVTIIERGANRMTRTITADSATLSEDRGAGTVQLRALGNVSIVMADAPDRAIRRNSERLTPMPLSEDALRQAKILTDAALLDPERSLKLGQRIEDKRKEIVAKVGKIDRAITGELHARMAFSLSVLVLVTLGAALAIVFRGAQVLVAFGISFVPSVLVVSLVIMGKQLIDKPATVQIGIAVIWLGLALVALLDVYVLAKMVRR